jgi:uncharacterized membrane protein YphA (DoxX/SURF4 family)
MFPTGTAGAALFLLRTVVAVNLLWEGTAHWALVTSAWVFAAFVVPALCLGLGLLTPYVAIIASLIQLVAAFEEDGRHAFHLGCSILSAVVVAALGPGAYSVDARLFGRRLLVLVTPRHRL